jgi:hypothetical protein
MTVLREMSVVKAQVKDPELLSTLLRPLELELNARAKAVASQLSMLEDPSGKAAGKK